MGVINQQTYLGRIILQDTLNDIFMSEAHMAWVLCIEYVCLGGSYGGFLKWGYPQIIHFSRILHYKPSILGYPHFRKTPDNHSSMIIAMYKDSMIGTSRIVFCTSLYEECVAKLGAYCNHLPYPLIIMMMIKYRLSPSVISDNMIAKKYIYIYI